MMLGLDVFLQTQTTSGSACENKGVLEMLNNISNDISVAHANWNCQVLETVGD